MPGGDVVATIRNLVIMMLHSKETVAATLPAAKKKIREPGGQSVPRFTKNPAEIKCRNWKSGSQNTFRRPFGEWKEGLRKFEDSSPAN